MSLRTCRHFFNSRGFAPSPNVMQVQTGVCDANPYEGSCSCRRTILRMLSFSFARRSQNRSRDFTVMSLAELFLVGIYCTFIAQMSITSIGTLLLLLWPWVFLEFTALSSCLSSWSGPKPQSDLWFTVFGLRGSFECLHWTQWRPGLSAGRTRTTYSHCMPYDLDLEIQIRP